MPVLFKTRAFLPYVAMVFLNAMVDLGHKILIQNTLFKSFDGNEQIILTAIVNALILLPFVLLFTPAGFIADRFKKNRVMRLAAWLAVALTLCITFAYYMGWFWLAFGLTLMLAMQSAIYSPAKYGYIKELVGVEYLAPANGVVQAATTTAILLGIFLFSVLFEFLLGLAPQEPHLPDAILQQFAPLGWLLVVFSVFELMLAYRLPDRHSGELPARFDWQRYRSGRYLRDNLGETWSKPVIRLAIIGLSVFWAVSQVVLAVFPAFAKEQMQITNTVLIQGMVASSGIGIVLGSMLAGRVSRAHIETGLIPLGASLMALCLFLLPAIDSVGWHALNFLVFGVAGGLFLVPLNALIQYHAGDLSAGRVLAANNFIQNITMLTFLSLVVAAALLQFKSVYMVASLGFIASAGAIYTVAKLPQSLVRLLVARLLGTAYRLQVLGFDHLPQRGGVLLLGNHISWIDWAVVQIASPRQVRFVMERSIYELWYLRWFLDLFGVVPIARGRSKQALQTIRELLQAGEVVCLFPEGQISRNGQLAEFRSGFERAAQGLDASDEVVIVPFYLRGLWGSRFSRASDKLKRNRSAGLIASQELTVSFGEPLPIHTDVATLKQAVTALSVFSWKQTAKQLPDLPHALAARLRRHPLASIRGAALIDGRGRGRSLLGVLVSAMWFARRLPAGRRVGLMLNDQGSALIASLGLLLAGRPILNLDEKCWQSEARAADVDWVITDTTLDDVPETLELRAVDAYLRVPGAQAFALALAWLLLPCRWLLPGKGSGTESDASLQTAALLRAPVAGRADAPEDASEADKLMEGNPSSVLFVELSHQNLLVNCRQIAEVLNLCETESIVANLPLHNALGLTTTTLMPLLEGVAIVLPRPCEDPTGCELELAKVIARNEVSLLCASPQLLQALVDHPRVYRQALASLRYLVCTEPQLDETLRLAFLQKFNLSVYIGYGAVETTPVASLNLPDQLDTQSWKMQSANQPHSVGMPLPGTRFRITDPATGEVVPVNQPGRIEIAGVQVMKGYLNKPKLSQQRILERDGERWFVSGQCGRLDEKGFLFLE